MRFSSPTKRCLTSRVMASPTYARHSNSSYSQATNTGNVRPNVITGVDYTSQSAIPRPDPEIPPLIDVRERRSSGLESGYVANEFTGHDRSIGASHPGLSSAFQYDTWNDIALSGSPSQSTLNMDKMSAKAISQDAQQTSGYHQGPWSSNSETQPPIKKRRKNTP